MKNIIALGASNSKNSINQTLATYAASKIPYSNMQVLDLNHYELPIYGVDLESQSGIPENAQKLSCLIESTDGLVISLAEHNGSYTAVFKNTLDWLSRIDIKVWKDKPMLLMATSPGARGGSTVLATAKTAFSFLGGKVIADFALPSFYENFSEGEIANSELRSALMDQIELFEKSLIGEKI